MKDMDKTTTTTTTTSGALETTATATATATAITAAALVRNASPFCVGAEAPPSHQYQQYHQHHHHHHHHHHHPSRVELRRRQPMGLVAVGRSFDSGGGEVEVGGGDARVVERSSSDVLRRVSVGDDRSGVVVGDATSFAAAAAEAARFLEQQEEEEGDDDDDDDDDDNDNDDERDPEREKDWSSGRVGGGGKADCILSAGGKRTRRWLGRSDSSSSATAARRFSKWPTAAGGGGVAEPLGVDDVRCGDHHADDCDSKMPAVPMDAPAAAATAYDGAGWLERPAIPRPLRHDANAESSAAAAALLAGGACFPSVAPSPFFPSLPTLLPPFSVDAPPPQLPLLDNAAADAAGMGASADIMLAFAAGARSLGVRAGTEPAAGVPRPFARTQSQDLAKCEAPLAALLQQLERGGANPLPSLSSEVDWTGLGSGLGFRAAPPPPPPSHPPATALSEDALAMIFSLGVAAAADVGSLFTSATQATAPLPPPPPLLPNTDASVVASAILLTAATVAAAAREQERWRQEIEAAAAASAVVDSIASGIAAAVASRESEAAERFFGLVVAHQQQQQQQQQQEASHPWQLPTPTPVPVDAVFPCDSDVTESLRFRSAPPSSVVVGGAFPFANEAALSLCPSSAGHASDVIDLSFDDDYQDVADQGEEIGDEQIGQVYHDDDGNDDGNGEEEDDDIISIVSFDGKHTGVLPVRPKTGKERKVACAIHQAAAADDGASVASIASSCPIAPRMVMDFVDNDNGEQADGLPGMALPYDLPAHVAARQGNLNALNSLLDFDEESFLVRNGIGQTALHQAVEHGQFAVVRTICTRVPACAKVQCDEGHMPLHDATSSGARHRDAPQITATLLSVFPGAIKATTDEGLLPVHLAAMSGFAAGIRTIFAYNFSTISAKENTEFMLALDFATDGLAMSTGGRDGVEGTPPEESDAVAHADAQHEVLSVVRQQPPTFSTAEDFEACIEILLMSALYKRPITAPRDEGEDRPFLPVHAAIVTRPLQRTWRFIFSYYGNYAADVDNRGRTPLHYLAATATSDESTDVMMAQFLQSLYSDAASQADQDGVLPLHHALLNPCCTYGLAAAILDCNAAAATVEVPYDSSLLRFRGFLPFQLAASSDLNVGVVYMLLRTHPAGIESRK